MAKKLIGLYKIERDESVEEFKERVKADLRKQGLLPAKGGERKASIQPIETSSSHARSDIDM